MTLHIETQGDGPPLVLLHGWGLHGGVWAEVAARLARRHTVHRVDLPGHGLTPWLPTSAESCRSGFSRDAAPATAPSAALLAPFTAPLAAAFPAPVTVCGWSLGALIALDWAARHPQQVQRLLLVAGTPRFAAAPDWPHGMASARVEDFEARLAAGPAGALHRFCALQAVGDRHPRAVTRALRQAIGVRPAAPQALAAGMDVLARADLRPLLQDIAAPTLLLHGEGDALMPIGAARWLAAQLPGGRLTAFPGCGHAPFLGAAEDFCAAAEDFLHE